MSLLYFFSVILFVCGFIDGMRNRLRRNQDFSNKNPTFDYCECGKRNLPVGDTRIVGGVKTSQSEYPWMTLIIGNGTKLAGGTLINDRYVVTAAHILEHKYRMNEMKVILGQYNVCKYDDGIVVLSITKLIIHPNYNNATLFADIMLVKLNLKIPFNEFISPICLPPNDATKKTAITFSDRNATVLGWGFADIGGDTCLLQMINLKIFNPLNCYSNIDTVICAGVSDGKVQDSCAGDSGGPLQVLNSRGKYELIGIVSSGFGCGTGPPGFYTDVPQMVPWIMQTTTVDSTYCWA